MRILLVAYEFPPVQSGQAIRWYHLANGLAGLGAEVDVVAPDFPGLPRFAGEFHPGVRVERTFAGPFVGLSNRLAARLGCGAGRPPEGAAAGSGAAEALYRAARSLLNHLLYPDVRSEWYPFARARLMRLVRERAYACVVASHEPGVDILLALRAGGRAQLPVILDLGDPFVTPLAPHWRRRLDAWAERRACAACDAVMVTCPAMRDFLVRERGVAPGRIHVVPQGTPEGEDSGLPLHDLLGARTAALMRDRMSFVFTGNFYRDFRNPEALAAALATLPTGDILFLVAGRNEQYANLFSALGESAVLLGSIPHQACTALQRAATVLVDIGNTQPLQVPGKLFEYLSAGRPILHVGSGDFGARLVEELRRGVAVSNERAAIAAELGRLRRMWKEGRLDAAFDLSPAAVAAHSWKARSESVLALLRQVAGGGGKPPGRAT